MGGIHQCYLHRLGSDGADRSQRNSSLLGIHLSSELVNPGCIIFTTDEAEDDDDMKAMVQIRDPSRDQWSMMESDLLLKNPVL